MTTLLASYDDATHELLQRILLVLHMDVARELHRSCNWQRDMPNHSLSACKERATATREIVRHNSQVQRVTLPLSCTVHVDSK